MVASMVSIAPIILAAGNSARMGYPKALLPLGSDIFLTHILKIVGNVGLPRPVIILGKTASIVQSWISGWPADILINPDPDRGQLSSIQLALSFLRPEFEAGLIWPVDQPAVSEELVRRLAQLFVTSESKIAYPVCGSKHGHPAIFHRTLFREFMEAPLEEGPKQILLRHENATAILPTSEEASVLDVDTPADYLALTGERLDLALARVKEVGLAQS
jgi:molybdenum cofactor cytidylyltransferase